MKSTTIISGIALAGGLSAAALGLSSGVANAAPAPGGTPIPAHWGPPPPGPGWGGPGPAGWGGPPPPPPPAPWNGGGPIPGGWNGGWEPIGGFCLGPFCV
ncbi:hypothetical protein H7K45_06865 [Mycobacterium yunnanensis]|uniref:Chitin-binding protein n=1 Tax=Mycobacterium yunnanensis TaxID=368477 RepID=A0A9X2YZ54_9MYCO|nr:hypothetical protein [Mycobacterium yunnanensis]MCV7420255.1 hypothetical protein [Mycobacterium yunnanensis]